MENNNKMAIIDPVKRRQRQAQSLRDVGDLVDAMTAPEAKSDLDFGEDTDAPVFGPSPNRKDGILLIDRAAFIQRLKEDKPKTTSSNVRVLDDYKNLLQYKRLFVADDYIISKLYQLSEEFPNFKHVVEEIINFAYKSMITKTEFLCPPMLFVGSPGIGKSAFMLRLSKYLTIPYKVLAMAGSRDIIKLAGLSQYWSTGAPSELVKFVCNHEVANPIVLLDEIDKASGAFNTDHGSNVQEVLLTLLERSTSATFEDGYIGHPTVNLSYINYVATANDLERIDKTLLSRFHVFKIEDIELSQRGEIIKNIFFEVHDEYKAALFVERTLNNYVVEHLANLEISLREVKRLIMRSMCKALIRSHNEKAMVMFSIKDIALDMKEKEPVRTMGFI